MPRFLLLLVLLLCPVTLLAQGGPPPPPYLVETRDPAVANGYIYVDLVAGGTWSHSPVLQSMYADVTVTDPVGGLDLEMTFVGDYLEDVTWLDSSHCRIHLLDLGYLGPGDDIATVVLPVTHCRAGASLVFSLFSATDGTGEVDLFSYVGLPSPVGLPSCTAPTLTPTPTPSPTPSGTPEVSPTPTPFPALAVSDWIAY